MPLKFKIYYACALYVLLWVVTMMSFICFAFFRENHGSPSANDYLILSAFWVVFGLYILKVTFSLRALRQYKLQALPGKAEKVFFIIFFAFTALFALIDIIACIAAIVDDAPDSLRGLVEHSNNPTVSNAAIIFAVSFFIITLSTIYLAIFDLVLAKAIKRKYYNSLANFEIGQIDATLN